MQWSSLPVWDWGLEQQRSIRWPNFIFFRSPIAFQMRRMQQRVSRSRATLEGIKTHLEEEAMEAENKSAIDLDISDSDRCRGRRGSPKWESHCRCLLPLHSAPFSRPNPCSDYLLSNACQRTVYGTQTWLIKTKEGWNLRTATLDSQRKRFPITII